MKLSLWQVDAFASERFKGNPAAVVPLFAWLPDETLLAIAAENNLAETAFLVESGADYEIRWFTPQVEVPLCGHATLASAWVVFHRLRTEQTTITFHSKSGPLVVERDDALLTLDFPANTVDPVAWEPRLAQALGGEPKEMFAGFQWLVRYETEAEIRALTPDFDAICGLGMHAVIVTAKGDEGTDFVSRFFAPAAGVPEDPVTGSAHTRLTPFWAARLGKSELSARQLSKRGGSLRCALLRDRVRMSGHAVLYLEGTIEIEEPSRLGEFPPKN